MKNAKINNDLYVLASGLMLNKFYHLNQNSKNNNPFSIHRAIVILIEVSLMQDKTDDQVHK